MPEASITTARDAILTLFKTAWDAQSPPVPAVEYTDNFPTDKDGSDEWAWIRVQHGPAKQATMGETGGRYFTRWGTVRVQIYTPLGEGRNRADTLAEVAAAAFEGETTASGTVWFRDVRIQEGGADPPWALTNVLADFEYDRVI